jgi:hypothetical protein
MRLEYRTHITGKSYGAVCRWTVESGTRLDTNCDTERKHNHKEVKSEVVCLHNRMALFSTDVSGVESMSCCKTLQQSLFMLKECHLWGRRINKWHYGGQSLSERKLKDVSKLGHDSSVSIATRSGLDGPGIESRWGRDFPHLSRPALGPTQPPVQGVPSHSRGWVGWDDASGVVR